MADDQALVERFIQGKFQNRFVILSDALCEFLNANQPIIEKVYVDTTVWQKKPLASLKGRFMQEALEKDTQSARQGLSTYNRMFGTVDHHLAIMGSNFGLPNFLQENGFPASRFNEFQDYLREYWTITYGEMINDWSQIKTELLKLRNILEKEIIILEHLPSEPYYQGIDKNVLVNTLFMEERDQFYKIMTMYKELNEHMFSKLSSEVKVQVSKTRAELKAGAKLLRGNFRRDLNSVRTRTQKSVIILIYLIGLFRIVADLRIKLKTKGMVKVIEKLWKYAGVERISESMENAKERSAELISITSEEINPKELLAVIEDLSRLI